GTATTIVDRLADAIRQAMASAEMKDRFAGGGSKAISTTPREFAAFIKEDTERWAPVVRASGARVE
ncbi:MAG: tripartite tricarboxylate transporter substrate binding protein, partial [Burkholderiales bacterium]